MAGQLHGLLDIAAECLSYGCCSTDKALLNETSTGRSPRVEYHLEK
ncbi:hypothetical protein NGB36_01490 [Streptomyces sp. RB6PN25]|uniref:Transposase n=1 Tax=Streptomyces humicola TaxID=2953240 RepID=A0ABT1PNQ4_9ACTN|nr:hypothetical protein [Streptomyces humicola]MCQ4079311.1 hypothetical protein [Streptomyces humicola]